MQVVLINPPVIACRRKGNILPVLDNLFFNSPPLGLAYIAAVLEKERIPVAIIDAAVERLSLSQLMLRIKKLKPEIIGMTSTTNLFDSAVEAARKIKECFPNLKLILGGSHLSANPYQALSFRLFDVGIIGEGEISFLELVRALEKDRKEIGQIKGLVFRRDNEVVFTQKREYIGNLDNLSFPARHLLPMEDYLPQPNDQFLLPKLSMITSRGCPYGCIFCDKSVFGRQYRSFSPAYILSEMEYLISNYGAKDIAFLDSTFTVSQERVEAIVDEIRRRNVKVNWTCTVRADVVNKELLKKMRDAGCWRIRVGSESGNDDVLKFIGKGITKQQVQNVVRWADQLGLQPKGFFMIGHLVDTKETIKETISFAKALPFKDITVQINTPMFNTPQYKICRDYGRFITDSYSDFSYWEPVFIPKGLNKEYLMEAYGSFYRSFYLRPVIFWRHFLGVNHWYNLVKYIRALRLFFCLFYYRVEYQNKE